MTLFAVGFEDFIGTAITIGILLLYAVNQLFEKGKQNPTPQRGSQRHPQQGNQWEEDEENTSATHLEQFLKQVQGQGGQRQQPEQLRRTSGTFEEEPRRPEPQQQRQRTQKPRPQPLQREQEESLADHHMESSVGERHLASSVGARHLEPEVSLLGDTDPRLISIGNEDVFSHGKLADDVAAQNPIAANIARVLSNPDTIRQAILLHEILDRPEHRWK